MEPWAVQLIGIIITILITVAGTSWKVSRIISTHEAKLLKVINEHQISDNSEFSKVRVEIGLTANDIRNEFGETGFALRQGIHNLELSLSETKASNFETFARRESMIAVNKEIAGNLKELVDKVEGLTIQVAKIDRPIKRT